MVPGQDLGLLAATGGVPVDVDPEGCQLASRALHPALVGKVLGPAVEAAAVTPDRLDDAADPPVTAREQALDDPGLAVVVAEADRGADAPVGADRVAQLVQPGIGVLGAQLRGPLEGSVRLGHEAADRHRAADVVAAADLAPGLDDLLGELGDLHDVLVGLGRQPAHEVELDLPPAGAIGRGDGVDQVLLGHHLVDDLADPLGPALGREGEAGAATVAGELVGQVDVEGVDPGRRERQTHLGALVAIGQALGHLADLGVVGAGEREQPDLLETGGRQAPLDHLADAGDAALTDRSGDHSGLTEPAASGAAAEDLDAHPLVYRLRQRHERLLRVGPGVEVHDRVLGHSPRHARVCRVRGDPLDPPVRQVGDVVEPRHVDRAGAGQAQEELDPAPRHTVPLPSGHDIGDHEDGLLAVADDGGVDEVGDGLGVEGGVAAGDDDRMGVVAVDRVQRDPAEVERGEHVGVAELGGETEAEEVEIAQGAVTVDGELRHRMGAHERLHVRPHRVGALGERVGALVEDFVQDHRALVGDADLVGVGVHQGPADRVVTADRPVLDGGVEFAADILDGLAHLLEQRLEGGEDRLTGHPTSVGSGRRDTKPPAREEAPPTRGEASLVCRGLSWRSARPAGPCTCPRRPCA